MVLVFIIPATRPPSEIALTEDLSQYSINGYITAKEESFTEVVSPCKDRLLVKAIQVGYCFHESSNPATTWNSLKNRPCSIQHEIDKWHFWKNSFTKVVGLQKDISIVMSIKVSYSFHCSSNLTTNLNSFKKTLFDIIDR